VRCTMPTPGGNRYRRVGPAGDVGPFTSIVRRFRCVQAAEDPHSVDSPAPFLAIRAGVYLTGGDFEIPRRGWRARGRRFFSIPGQPEKAGAVTASDSERRFARR
jgi:hypothetical protein